MDAQSERQLMVAGRPYLAGDPELVASRARARRLAHAYSAIDPASADERRALLTALFRYFGDDVVVEAPFHCDYGWNISLGRGVYVKANAVILDCAPVTVGPFTLIGPGVQLCAATHPADPAERARGVEYALPIGVGANVWIAASVVVGPGVTIGDNSTVGAGSVVLEDVPANVVVAGNPARVVRRL
jgi:maltose O-acetyltransferase